ncbi:MAG TPA: diacylglycerol kinase family protein [Candidatus Dormibacteraeota bacterium]|nr:diacylglycerol kinase family protein [Candidatus Dormibacteraeota bacterium]
MNPAVESRHVTIILNCAAGSAKKGARADRFREIFEEYGIEARIHELQGGEGITDLARSAVRNGSFAVVAGGGDGTVNAVASAVVDSDCALGILPLGTLNHFAKDLRIPLDAEKAARTIATGTIKRVDVGEVNGKIFVNNSGLGLYPSVVRGREQQQRLGRSKWAALFWGTLAVLRRYPVLLVRLISPDGRKLTRRTPVIFIGNNQYQMKGLEIGSRTSLDKGTLSVYIVHAGRPVSLIRMTIEALIGRIRRGRDFDFLEVENLQIDVARKEIQVATDGEVLTFVPPLMYRIRHLALRVIIPAGE